MSRTWGSSIQCILYTRTTVSAEHPGADGPPPPYSATETVTGLDEPRGTHMNSISSIESMLTRYASDVELEADRLNLLLEARALREAIPDSPASPDPSPIPSPNIFPLVENVPESPAHPPNQ